ncbi:MAG: CsoS2 family carboxysome shell protein [Burkholderiales bacterium]
MTHAAESHASATLSGRELALKRRQAMALHGKNGVGKPAPAQARPTAASWTAPLPAASASPASHAVPAHADDQALVARLRNASGMSPARARREALSRSGKAALQKTAATRPSGRVRPSRQQAGAADSRPAGCGCGCGGTNPACGAGVAPAAASSEPLQVRVAKVSEQATGRALARARRAALAQDGKAGLKRVAQATKIAAAMPGQDWQAAITKGATGRQIAMQRRLVQALAGRTGSSQAESRPSGRMRARNLAAPSKVEEGHTLAGQPVTGTMTDRSRKVTGNEPGACRPVTGTEYVGAEQFDKLCDARRPAPNPAKVGVSSTLREHRVTGTELGRSQKVTGDEPGACRGITGTEYLSAERYAEFCASKPAPAPAKVGVTETAKGEKLSGTLVGRSSKVTGDEPGADRNLTGTRYMSNAADTAPDKVAVTHTASGKSVTGTAVGHTSRITGDEPGACRGITGTEYLAAEQFSTVCGTEVPPHPRKVSVMSSRGSETVSGTSVNRAENVTGNEPGSCRSITGSQYYTQSDFAPLCNAGNTGPRKVSVMPTLGGRAVTGTEVAPSPKLSGDESYGCKPVTGTDYIGTAQLAAVCDVGAQNAVSPVAKVVVDTTLRGQAVTGSYPGRAGRVTGNEMGACSPVSGTPYIGRGQFQAFCPAPDYDAQAARVRQSAVIPATAVTGDRPGAGGSAMTGDERGACEVISGTPYVGIDNSAGQCATSGRFVARTRNFEVPSPAPAPADFSIESPARYAQRQRFGDVTGSAFAAGRITGPVNKADGLITGTPEFRHRDSAAAAVEQAEAVAAARRLTGEGREIPRITGDAWHAETRVTGTEGASSQGRNFSQRGQPRGAGVNAQVFREIERVEVPESRITGSSGNTGKGAVVTLSGGARG